MKHGMDRLEIKPLSSVVSIIDDKNGNELVVAQPFEPAAVPGEIRRVGDHAAEVIVQLVVDVTVGVDIGHERQPVVGIGRAVRQVFVHVNPQRGRVQLGDRIIGRLLEIVAPIFSMITFLIVIGVFLLSGGVLLAYGLRHAPVGEETPDGFREVAAIDYCHSISPNVAVAIRSWSKNGKRSGRSQLRKKRAGTNSSVHGPVPVP